jgi:hypothetical protein
MKEGWFTCLTTFHKLVLSILLDKRCRQQQLCSHRERHDALYSSSGFATNQTWPFCSSGSINELIHDIFFLLSHSHVTTRERKACYCLSSFIKLQAAGCSAFFRVAILCSPSYNRNYKKNRGFWVWPFLLNHVV